MADIKNPNDFDIYSDVLGRSLGAYEVVGDLDDELAERACTTGIFELHKEQPDDENEAQEPESSQPAAEPETETDAPPAGFATEGPESEATA